MKLILLRAVQRIHCRTYKDLFQACFSGPDNWFGWPAERRYAHTIDKPVDNVEINVLPFKARVSRPDSHIGSSVGVAT